MQYYQYDLQFLLAPLTEEEVAAIDAAGAKGPPVTLASMKEHLLVRKVRTVWLLTSFLIFLALLGYYRVCCLGVQRFAS